MKLSISNLSWGSEPLRNVAPQLKSLGMDGIEIAPTAIWPDLSQVSINEVTAIRDYLSDEGLQVSGIQSLLFGHPEFQLFNQNTWNDMIEHLKKVISIGGSLGTNIAVFGSPRNRVKGNLTNLQANYEAVIFFEKLLNVLDENGIVLTLEPNAPEYGADYLINYDDVVSLSKLISSKNIAPQIDTGCLWMVGESPAEEFEKMAPHHIHLSTPNLGEVPGKWNFTDLFETATENKYSGWLVIESLSNKIEDTIKSAKWLSSQFERH